MKKRGPGIDQLYGDDGHDEHRQNHDADQRGHAKIQQAAAGECQLPLGGQQYGMITPDSIMPPRC